ncbi:MAG: hypothetical protein ABH859_00385 [Pseudomonadota bacterium]
MKLNRLIVKTLLLMILVAGLSIPAQSMAKDLDEYTDNPRYPYHPMDINECTVTNRLWDDWTYNRDDLTMVVALHYASPDINAGDLCKKTIYLQPEGGSVSVRGPIVITRGGGSDVGDSFTIKGDMNGEDGQSDRVILDAARFDMNHSQTESWFGAEPAENCFITIKEGVQHVTLENIEITNLRNSDIKPICVQGNNVTIKNVVVNTPGDGIVFDGASSGSRIKASSGIIGGNGYGIVFNSPANSFSSAVLEAAADGAGNWWRPSAADAYGLGIPPDNYETFTIQKGDADKFFKNDNSNIQIVIDQLERTTQDPVTGADKVLMMIRGRIVEGDPDTVTECAATNKACCLPTTGLIPRIQIYVGGETSEAGFYGYIAPSSSSNQNAVGVGNLASQYKGQIYAYLDKASDAHLGKILLIPEGEDGNVGRPKILDLTPGQIDCTDAEGNPVGSSVTPGGGYTPGGGSASGASGFISQAHCQRYRGLTREGQIGGAPTPPGQDSDGDTLDDDFEDANLNCVCERNLGETCWDDPDSDNDGIMDGAGQEQACRDITGKLIRCDKVDDTTGESLVDSRYNYDADRDGVANALDTDSDNDGRPDNVEDRLLIYEDILETLQEYKGGIMYRIGTLFDARPITYNGEIQRCDLGNDKSKGVRYFWYRMKYSADGYTLLAPPEELGASMPETGNPEDPAWQGYVLEMVQCRHQALTGRHNFDGDYTTDALETNFVSSDTDRDGYCDGDNNPAMPTYADPAIFAAHEDGCAGTALDLCPTITDRENRCAEFPCEAGTMLYTVDPRFTNVNEENVPHSLKKVTGYSEYLLLYVEVDGEGNAIVGDNGKPQMASWQEILARAPIDTDSDGLPDFVEAPNSICGLDRQTGLSPVNNDSDGDGKLDNADVCPAIAESYDGEHVFADTRNENDYCGIQYKRVYDKSPALALFLDRDGDGLRDGEEDKNLDGEWNNTPGGMAGIGVAESHVLKVDTDSDGIDDRSEVHGWGTVPEGTVVTNPADDDTDEDGLLDGLEDRDGIPGISFGVIRLADEGCSQAMTRDTNPMDPDSDGDGIQDGTEVDGNRTVGQEFINAILADINAGNWPFDLISDPTNPDTDGDGKSDLEEYGENGKIDYNESNPCMSDSDGDAVPDDIDLCPTNPNGADAATCGSMSATGVDSDNDGLPDRIEEMIGTNPRERDTDADGIPDGEENFIADDVIDRYAGETDPNAWSSDEDGLSDRAEQELGTDPWHFDTDGDCIPDGPMQITDRVTGEIIQSLGEDKNGNGRVDADETSPTMLDTDGDGLPDGYYMGFYEDGNCNGQVDVDARGFAMETSPINPDTDGDGMLDKEEMAPNGYMEPGRAENALVAYQGCSMLATGAGQLPTGISLLIGMVMLVGMRINRRRRS